MAYLDADMEGSRLVPCQLKRVTAPHTPVPYSKVLEGHYLPDKDRVVRTARELLDR